jgi:hypothetical protein
MPRAELCSRGPARICPVGRLPQVYLYLRPGRLRNDGTVAKDLAPCFITRSPQADREAALSLRAACHDWPRSELQGAVHDCSAMRPTTPGQRGSTGSAL